MILRDLDIKIERNPIVHIFSANTDVCEKRIVSVGRTEAIELMSETGQLAISVRSQKKSGYGPYGVVFLQGSNRTRCVLSTLTGEHLDESPITEIRNSWDVSIPLVQIDNGLRDAQRGALLAIFSHWTRSNSPATVVMPTGTGKTESLLATVARLGSHCAVVIVPTDPLRSQFFTKALMWGKLRALGVLGVQSRYPIVGMLRYGFKSLNALETFFTSSQIVVTTMPILAAMRAEELDIVRRKCDLVAVDEAHHLGAPSWRRVVDEFQESRVLQFTATPFRYDGKHIGGEIIYTYPLGRCQHEGFFRPIDFLPITEFVSEKADEAICDMAVERLRKDITGGYQHALMARTASKDRARRVFALYQEKCPDLNPTMIYSGMPTAEKDAAKSHLFNGRSKVVVCVDMLGEGFDYPPLKVAAIHDPHKSLPITLQFIGRFTRSGDQAIGDASVVANIADPKMQANVSLLYSQDADWDTIIHGSYENAVGHEIEFQRFINGFVFDGIEGFSLRNIRPKYSAFVYSASGIVDFEKLKAEYNDGTNYRLSINTENNVAVIIHKQNQTVDWGRIAELENTNYHCYCLYYDENHQLLFVFASNGEIPDPLVTAVSSTATRITDRRIHRCLHGINRLMLSNVGLRQRLIGPIRYRQYIGLDVGQGLKDRISENTYTALLFGLGYENANKSNVGCSLKGKIWSRNAGALMEWTEWCNHVGRKIIDESINVEAILEGVLFPEVISAMPDGRTVIQADWSDFIFENMFERTSVRLNTTEFNINECAVTVVDSAVDQNTIQFVLEHGDSRTVYALTLTKSVPEGYTIACVNEHDCEVTVGREKMTGSDFFEKNPPMFWLDDSSVIADGCLLIRASHNQAGGIYDPSTISIRDWSGIDIRVESQGEARRPESIQRAIIEDALNQNPLFVIDDDGSGEIADVVAAYDQADILLVRFYHCKYSTEGKPGCRIGDMYELCGQAQKSVKWAGSVQLMVDHLRRRENLRVKNGRPTRFEAGDMSDLSTFTRITRQKRVRFEVVLVQPGLSKAALLSGSEGANSILRILGGAAAYLAETFEMRMSLIASE